MAGQLVGLSHGAEDQEDTSAHTISHFFSLPLRVALSAWPELDDGEGDQKKREPNKHNAAIANGRDEEQHVRDAGTTTTHVRRSDDVRSLLENVTRFQ